MPGSKSSAKARLQVGLRYRDRLNARLGMSRLGHDAHLVEVHSLDDRHERRSIGLMRKVIAFRRAANTTPSQIAGAPRHEIRSARQVFAFRQVHAARRADLFGCATSDAQADTVATQRYWTPLSVLGRPARGGTEGSSNPPARIVKPSVRIILMISVLRPVERGSILHQGLASIVLRPTSSIRVPGLHRIPCCRTRDAHEEGQHRCLDSAAFPQVVSGVDPAPRVPAVGLGRASG